MARHHALCVQAGADLLQGYFYARPAAALEQDAWPALRYVPSRADMLV